MIKSIIKNKFLLVLTILFIIFILIQLVPYGRDHSNPPIVNSVHWDNLKTHDYFYRACKDCHSNETEWPWYSNIAPVSWLVQSDVDKGRKVLNISESGRALRHADDAAEMVEKGEMPLWYYLPAHPEASLSDQEKEEFAAGLSRTFGESKKNDLD